MQNNCQACLQTKLPLLVGQFHCIAFAQGEIFAPGQLQIITLEHLSLYQLSHEAGLELFKFNQLCIKALEKTLNPDGYNLYNFYEPNLHFCQQIIPRFAGDVTFLHTINSGKPIVAKTELYCQQLTTFFCELAG